MGQGSSAGGHELVLAKIMARVDTEIHYDATKILVGTSHALEPQDDAAHRLSCICASPWIACCQRSPGLLERGHSR